MNTNSLSAFLYVADTLHFSRAAALSNLSASALTRTIQRLEDELGCRLFERNNRGVRLTAKGRILQAQAGELLERLRDLERQLRAPSEVLQGAVSLYCSVTASYSLLSSLLPDFRHHYPGIEIKVHTGDEASALHRVTQGREDVAIAAHPGVLPAHIEFLELAKTPLVFVAPMAGLASPRSDRQWGEVPIIIPEAGQARDRIDRWFGAAGMTPNIYAQVSGNEAIVGMVALGCGIGVVPLLVLNSNPFRESVRILEDAPELPPFHIGLCARKRTLENPLVAALWRLAGVHEQRG
jgi:LysR family transcriptional regulator, positive regulator for ilvC